MLEESDSEIQKISADMGLQSETTGRDIPALSLPTSDCLLIKEDNLAALKGLVGSGIRANFCYIDPPYNTGSDFIYGDSRRTRSSTIWGEHKAWMEFMLPRLVYAKAALADNGILAVSIDDYAFPHLKILLDCIFGEPNNIGTLIVVRSQNGLGSNRNVADMHEYVVLYGRSSQASLRGILESDKEYEKKDAYGEYTVDGLFRKKGEASRREDRPNMFYPLYYSTSGEVYVERIRDDLQEVFPVDSSGVERRWLWGKEKASNESWRLFASKKGVIYVKNYRTENKRVRLRSILAKPEYLSDAATREIKEIYGAKLFETPKPLRLVQDLVDCCSDEGGVILDFFAGTGTTAEAVATLNSGKSVKRKVILVEIDSPIPEGHVARGFGFQTTADLTQKRLESTHVRYPDFDFVVI